MLNSEQNDEECDATDDASSTAARQMHSSLNPVDILWTSCG
ncbi:MAG: hypothetical protein WDN26_03365 [Chitinophagaceae bacterium]